MIIPAFHKRSDTLELLDGAGIASKDLYRNYKELHWVNSWLGGYRTSLKLFQYFRFGDKNILWDIGCGGGETLKKIAKRAKERHIPIGLYGIDQHKPALDYAQKNNESNQLHWIHSSYQEAQIPETPDIIHCALFTHHLDPKSMQEFLLWTRNHARQGILINDLRRSFPAWLGIWLLSRWPGLSYLFRNDAPLSVLRSYSRGEWQQMLSEAGYSQFVIRQSPVYRYCICAYV